MMESSGVSQCPRVQLMDLPAELHMEIASFLSYPDALALKHTCRDFYYMVYTGVHLKVDWLVERFERKLECPMEKCSFRTDEVFCNWRIRRIMERRRQHRECRRAPGGCWVVEGRTCKKELVPAWLNLKPQNYKLINHPALAWSKEGSSDTCFAEYPIHHRHLYYAAVSSQREASNVNFQLTS